MSKKIILKGKLVNLRPLSLNDAPNYCRWLADLEVTTFLSMYEATPPKVKEEREWIQERKKDKKTLVLAIETKAGEHIGSVGLHKIDDFNRHAEYGIFIGNKKYWGQGYGTEAGQLMIDYAFKKLKLRRVYLRYIAYNIRGQKSYKKIGFRVEGVFRKHIFRDGYFHDEIYMGILKEEWQKNKK